MGDGPATKPKTEAAKLEPAWHGLVNWSIRRTDGEKPTTKPKTEADVADMETRRQLMEELFGERTIVSSGKRSVNRPQDYKKEQCVEDFVAEKKVDDYPIIVTDVEDENLCGWLDWIGTDKEGINVTKRATMREALEDEIGRAHTICNAEPPLLASAIALKLLSSDLDGKTRMLSDLTLPEITVEVVLAHLEALGYGLPKRIALGVARRATLLLLNRHRFQPVGC